MPTFVMMTKLSPETLGDPQGRKAVGKEWLAKVGAACPVGEVRAKYGLW